MNWYVEQVLGLIVLGLIIIALGWELRHLLEWCGLLSEDPAGYRRKHAYDYITWMLAPTSDGGWEHDPRHQGRPLPDMPLL